MAATRSDNIKLALAAAASLNSSPTYQTERASLPSSLQLSNKLAASNKFLCEPGCGDDHRLLLQLNDTRKKLAESAEELKDQRDEKNVLLDKIW